MPLKKSSEAAVTPGGVRSTSVVRLRLPVELGGNASRSALLRSCHSPHTSRLSLPPWSDVDSTAVGVDTLKPVGLQKRLTETPAFEGSLLWVETLKSVGHQEFLCGLYPFFTTLCDKRSFCGHPFTHHFSPPLVKERSERSQPSGFYGNGKPAP